VAETGRMWDASASLRVRAVNRFDMTLSQEALSFAVRLGWITARTSE
jgi:hypothetical protein